MLTPAEMPPLPPGQVLLDKYEIKGELGQGGFSRVYRAHSRAAGEDVALKVVASYGQSQTILPLLQAEYRAQTAMTDLTHVLRCEAPDLANFQNLEWLLLPMELAEKSLADWLAETRGDRKGRLEEGLDLFRQACRGLAAIHRAGFIHRDVKPGNLLLLRDKSKNRWRLKVSDFGLALGMYSLAETHPSLLADNIGTPAYMAPEQIMVARPKDIKEPADIYGLGMILYELLDGDLPYEGSAETIRAKKQNERIIISPPVADAPAFLSEVAMGCLDRAPGQRPASAIELERLVSRNPDEDAAFTRAEKQNSEAGWEKFLSDWPDGWRVEEARIHLAELQRARQEGWVRERARLVLEVRNVLHSQEGAEEALRLLGGHLGDKASSDTEYGQLLSEVAAVRRSAEERDFREAEGIGTEQGWAVYLSKWPDGKLTNEAKRQKAKQKLQREAREAKEREQAEAEEADYQRAVQRNTEEAMGEFLRKWPKGTRSYAAQSMLARLEAARKAREAEEEKDYLEAERRGTEDGWAAYLRKWPDGAGASEAKNQQAKLRHQRETREAKERKQAEAEEADYQRAVQRNTEEAMGEFLRKWPKGNRSYAAQSTVAQLEAARRAREAEEEKDYQRAFLENTGAAWTKFKLSWPFGKRYSDACRMSDECEERDFHSALRQNTVAGWESFLNTWPTSPGAEEVMERIAQLRQEREERERREREEGEKTFTNSIGMEFVKIPAGSFMMGSNIFLHQGKPVHRVNITRAFYLQTTPVTQWHWESVMGNNPSNFKGANRPVENVSWDDAMNFIQRLNSREGGDKYRLPTEAEWEYACRAGSSTEY